MTPEQHVKQLTKASKSNFYYAFLFLPKKQRMAINAFYAFCREVDDVVDKVQDKGVAKAKLDWWQNEVTNTFCGKPSHPIMIALSPSIEHFSLKEIQLQSLIQGCVMDLEQNRYLNYDSLTHYCHLVAGVVGEVAAIIFGQTTKATTIYAHTLGLAFQLTNIIRDVGEDALRGRIYIPINELEKFEVTEQEILQRTTSQRFYELMKWQAQRAHALYNKALAQLPMDDYRSQKPGLIMASLYRTLLKEIERDGFSVLSQRISLTPLRKLWIAWKVQALGAM